MLKTLKMIWFFLTIPEARELMDAGLTLHRAALGGVEKDGDIIITYKDGTVKKMSYHIAPGV